jgi:hypothetical protein
MWEYKQNIEELLNKLIEKWWKPFDRNYQRYEHWCLIREFTTEDGVYSYWQYPTTYREFCSKESWLWQYVCENGMINNDKLRHTRISQVEWWLDVDCVRKTNSSKYEYRLIETALTDEDRLEEFLLNNIKIDVDNRW